MQADLADDGLTFTVRMLGVNQQGSEGGNAGFVAGSTLPWLQDVPAVNAWGLWGVTLRDVVVLDADNRVTATYNVGANDLGTPANYDALKALIVAAGAP